MATQVDNTSAGEGDDVFMDDQRGDGKKKKFKPFQKMRNFFRGGSKKRKVEEDDGPISQSTGALHHHIVNEEDDDDGGFKRKGLAGSRSISEDSVFQQEPKDASIAVLKGQAASMEAINTGFQAELFSKIKLRQSDSSLDDGLTYSPEPMVSPTRPGLRSRTKSEPIDRPSQDSHQSLIRGDGSDEDLFSTNWKAGVASVKTRSYSGNDIDKTMEVSDFEVVQMKSTSLSNEAAKHRISIKPKSRRLSSKMSMKLKEKPNVQVLSDVKEEPTSGPAPSSTSGPAPSGTSLQTDSKPERLRSEEMPTAVAKLSSSTTQQKNIISTTIAVGSPPKPGASIIPPRSEPREIPQTRRHDDSELQKARSLSPVSTSPVSKATLDEVKLKSRPLSGKFEGVELRREPLQNENELSKAFNKAKRFSRKYDEDGNIVESSSAVTKQKESEVKKEAESVKVTPVSVNNDKKSVAVSQPASTPAQVSTSKTTTTTTTSSVTTGTTGVTFVLKKEPLRSSVKTVESSETSASKLTNSGTKDSNVTVKQEQKKTDTAATLEVKSQEKIGSAEKLASPREDYRLKRQSRSKTLPVSQEILDKNEDSVGQKPSSRSGSPPLRSTARYGENTSLNTTPIQSKRSSWAPSSASSSSEPEWIMKSRLKKMEHDNQNKEVKLEIKKDSKPEVKTSVSSTEKVDDKPEKENKTIEKPSVTSNIKSIIEKEKSSSGPAVRSWGQAQSVKPTVQSSAKVSTTTSSSATPATSVSVNVRPSVSSAKPAITTDKTLSQSVKPPVSSLNKPASDKPLSQSARASPLDSKFSQFGGKVSSQKPPLGGTSVQPLSQSVKVTTQSAGTSATTKEPIKTSVTTAKSSITTDTKKPVSQMNKKQETEKKPEPVTKQAMMFDKPKTVTKPVKPETSSNNLPPWKQALNQRKNNNPISQQVKIEIIDKEPEKPVEKKVEKKVDQKPVVEMRDKPKPAPEKCSDSNRSSKVLDMVKSFQKLQVT